MVVYLELAHNMSELIRVVALEDTLGAILSIWELLGYVEMDAGFLVVSLKISL